MKPQPFTSPFARLAFTLLAAMWTIAGWYLVLTKTFSTSHIRSNSITTVNGYPAQFMGFLFVALGLIAMTVVLRSFSLRRDAQFLVALVCLIVPPFSIQIVLGQLK